MKIIALLGEPNSGKTTTLKKLIEKIYQQGGIIIEFKKGRKHKKWSPQCTLNYLLGATKEDVTVVFDYMGNTIVVTTCGDSEELIAPKYKLRSDCSCFVCAAHLDGSSFKYVQELALTNTLITVPKIACKGDDASPDFWAVAGFSEDLAIKHLLNVIP
jgi:GTPase SAR1 family protein